MAPHSNHNAVTHYHTLQATHTHHPATQQSMSDRPSKRVCVSLCVCVKHQEAAKMRVSSSERENLENTAWVIKKGGEEESANIAGKCKKGAKTDKVQCEC